MGQVRQVHQLKCLTQFFRAIKKGNKAAELRLDDRHYQVNDILYLREIRQHYPGAKPIFTGRVILCEISHITRSGYGLKKNHVMLSFKRDIVDAIESN